jgi:gluconate 5-dehydrogenase
MENLNNYFILITGSTGYIGSHLSKALCAHGATVLLQGKNYDRLMDLHASIERLGGKSFIICNDLTQPFDWRDSLDKLGIKHLNCFINNAYSFSSGCSKLISSSDFVREFETQISSSHTVVNSILPLLSKALIITGKGSASIINMGSMYGSVSPKFKIYESPNLLIPPSYAAVKGALSQWSRYLACELAPAGIRVNCLSPGAFPSDAVRVGRKKFVSNLLNEIPMGYIGIPNDLVGPVIFLLSRHSSYITGINLPVDGGWTAQ